MFRRIVLPTFTGTTPAAAGTAVVTGMVATGLSKFEMLTLDALLIGATGGTLDVYLQRLVDQANGVWLDWARFTQLAAGAAAKYYTIGVDAGAAAPAITNVGKWSADAQTGAIVLASNAVVPCHPGDQLRVVAVAGASTSVGAALSMYITGYERNT